MHSINLTILLLLSLLHLAHGNQTKLFTRGPAFTSYPNPTFNITSPDLGKSGSPIPIDYSADGAGLFPSLSWRTPPAAIEEYVLISEDPDAPLAEPVVHGIYFGIPPVFTGVNHADFMVDESKHDAFRLTGGFKYGENRGEGVYLAPAPLPGHGRHRYFFQLVALSGKVDQRFLSDLATREEILREVEGKVVGWGEWVGVMERE
ncbi:YbhB/YbcL family Raf kinase inhibitor-like protein [Aspergillus candidus]|uniref:Phosphatidylethanolamine-binding protein n=1 Tax=Aspergillus candidus TaxID=41067 RepID=A0A2I2FPM3_ASPCN|nr:phosphatidylethanolamine-binding protein [Aspergillus candidus]PLB42576.1 phosphatidylethanolamine-binding protein [Aspergillus candidus]